MDKSGVLPSAELDEELNRSGLPMAAMRDTRDTPAPWSRRHDWQNSLIFFIQVTKFELELVCVWGENIESFFRLMVRNCNVI